MEVMTAINLIDQNSFFLDKLFKDFNVLHSEVRSLTQLLDQKDVET